MTEGRSIGGRGKGRGRTACDSKAALLRLGNLGHGRRGRERVGSKWRDEIKVKEWNADCKSTKI